MRTFRCKSMWTWKGTRSSGSWTGKPLDVRQYGSLQELIENELEGLDFQELVAVDEKDIQLSLARAEYQENVECKLAIEQAIACYYDGSRLDSAAAREVV